MYKVSVENIQETHTRVTSLRIIVLLCLASIGGGGGYFIYYLLNQMEEEICALQYNSVADLIQASIISNFESKVNTGQELAKAFGIGCPNTFYWPKCPYDLDVFEFVSNSKYSGARVSGFGPFVKPYEIEEYENFTTNLFETDERYPKGTGISSFGRGIYSFNRSLHNSDKRYHDTTGITSYGSRHRIAVPVFVLDNYQTNYYAIMYNLHSESIRGHAIDILLDCMNYSSVSTSSTVSATSLSTLETSESSGCDQSSLTDFIHAVIDSGKSIPTTAIYSPIYPVNNRSIMTGISYVLVYWDEIVNVTLPDSFPELIVVVKTYRDVISYSFRHGVVHSLGNGDHHDIRYNNHRKSISFKSHLVSSLSVTYEINVYPTQSFCQYYNTPGPIFVLVGLICMMVITAILFGLYDYFMKSESLLRKLLLESKRLFVRFISHELRTPLNAVSLGLNLLEKDIEKLLSLYPLLIDTQKMERNNLDSGNSIGTLISHGQNSNLDSQLSSYFHPQSPSHPPSPRSPKSSASNQPHDSFLSHLKSCLQLIHEAHENTDIAIVVLNDMLQYDKIESKSLQCECIENNPWEIIQEICQELSLQAKASNVNLIMKLQINFPETDDIWKLYPLGTYNHLKAAVVIGDPFKLGQVIRNLISNALKFSPSGEDVTIHGYWVANGLSNVTLPKCSESYQRYGSIRIEVIDNGPGITKEGKESLFQEGVQLNPNQLQCGQGSGLGLWIAKGITIIHSGIIGVECEGLGKGSKFFLELPLIAGFENSQSHAISGENPYLQDDIETYPLHHRIWRWNDPRNNIEPQNQNKYSKRSSPKSIRDSSSTIRPQKIIPLANRSFDAMELMEIDHNGNGSEVSTILTQKHINPQVLQLTLPSNISTIDGGMHEQTPSSKSLRTSKTGTMSANGSSLLFSSDLASQPSLGNALRQPLKILIVDDAPSNRKLLFRTLSNLGHNCDTATNGQECLDVIIKKSNYLKDHSSLPSPSFNLPVPSFPCPYDLILMDSEMPIMNGPTATKLIRYYGFHSVVILGVTGNVLPDDIDIFMQHGVDAVIGKPLSVEIMWKEYGRILQEKISQQYPEEIMR